MADVAAYDVSVVIYARDAAENLAECVRSVVGQEGVALQVVIVDDASTDETPSLAGRIASAHPDIVAVSRLEGGHRTLAWLDGVSASKGAYVCLLEAADRLREGALAALVDVAREREAAIVAPSVAIVEEAEATELEGYVPRLESPPATWYGPDVLAIAVFGSRELAPTIRGRLFETRLLRRALAELGDVDLGPCEDEALTFVLLCLGPSAIGWPSVVSAILRRPAEPEVYSPDDLRELCRGRETLDVIAAYLERSEGWEEHEGDWELFSLLLAAKAIEPFPRFVAPTDWAEAATLLIRTWGAPTVAALLATTSQEEQLISAVALCESEELSRPSSRLRRALLCLGASTPSGKGLQIYRILNRRMDEVLVVVDDDAEVDERLSPVATLPLDQSVLERAQSLERLVADTGVDAVVLFSGHPQGLWDLFVARVAGCATGLVSDWDECLDGDDPLAYDPQPLLARAAEATMAQVVAVQDGCEGGAWKLLGSRVTTIDGLLSQLTLGTGRAMDLSSRLLAIRLAQTAARLLARQARDEAHIQALMQENESLQQALEAQAAEDQPEDDGADADGAGEAPAEEAPEAPRERRRLRLRDLRKRP